MLLFDIETNGFLDALDTCFCAAALDTNTNTMFQFDPEGVSPSQLLMAIEKASREGVPIVAHNAIGFDVPALKKLYPDFKGFGEVIDTLVWSRLAFPDIRKTDFNLFKKDILPGNLIGSHSLKAWGYRLKEYKGEWSDWSKWSREMSEYNVQDVVVLKKLVDLLSAQNVSPEALKLEHQVAEIIFRQEQKGFMFDVSKAEALYLKLRSRQEEIQKELIDRFGSFYVGGKTFTPKAFNKKYGYYANAPCTKIELVEFNPSSRQHIAKVLTRGFNWKPLEFTDQGEPKVSDEILASLPYPEAKLIAEYLMLDKRLGQLAEGNQGWLKAYNTTTGRIHGSVNTCGAVTGRMTHSHPNMAQVPAVYSPYGKDCRGLFTVPTGYKLVGCDAAGLEARCLGHYMARYDGGKYAEAVVSGSKDEGTDIHTLNMNALGINDRDVAKTFFYAFIYGAGDEKLGAILGKGRQQGASARKRFLARVPALGKLVEAVGEAVSNRGFLVGLDRRKLNVRSSHAALNTLLQSAGAVIMKKALVIADEELFRRGYDYEFVANIHDEFQLEVKAEDAEAAGEVCKKAIQLAGEHFKFRCPLDGDYGVGDNWAETH